MNDDAIKRVREINRSYDAETKIAIATRKHSARTVTISWSATAEEADALFKHAHRLGLSASQLQRKCLAKILTYISYTPAD